MISIFNHLIGLMPGDCKDHLKMMNEAVRNQTNIILRRWRRILIQDFPKNELFKCIGCIVFEVRYRKK